MLTNAPAGLRKKTKLAKKRSIPSKSAVPIATIPPIIIGSGLTGLTISRTLTQAQIPHTLIGGPPNSLPRLGESLNLEGTLGLLEMFPEFSAYFFTKKVVTAYLGDYVFSCDFVANKTFLSRLLFRLMGYTAPKEFLQFDRLGFDAALYAQTVASEYCTQIDVKVTSLDYERESDRITTLHLSDGSTLPATYVFDATNHGLVVARATGIRRDTIGVPQRVVYTHYHLPDYLKTAPPAPEPWEIATSIVKLYPEIDGVDGIAWCIPLGTYVSIGVSTAADATKLLDEELLAVAERAYARRGLHYRRRFVETATIMGTHHHYFVHERAYGANWLLAGPAYAQVWWMAGAGVGTGFAAAQIAPQVLQAPQEVGRTYHDYLRHLIGIHGTFDWFALSKLAEVTPEGIIRQSDRFVLTNLRRLARSTALEGTWSERLVGAIFARLCDTNLVIKNYCTVYRAPLEAQTATVFSDAQ